MNVMPEIYFEEIYRGHDCCKDYTNPKNNLSIQPYRSVIGPRDSIRLWAKGFHLDCDQGCISWELIKGAGSLQNEFGDENVYYSPAYNEGCEGNATIVLNCGGYVAAWAYVATNMYTPATLPAYLRLLPSPKLYRFIGDTDVLQNPITSAPGPGFGVTWLERYMGRSYLCDSTFYGEYLLMTITKRYIFDWEKGKWYITESPRTFTTQIVNDKIPFGWKYVPGKSQTIDIRSPRMKTEGCCPQQLLPGD